MAFANRLKAARERAKLTQAELSEVVKIHAVTLSRYETGERQPKIDDAQKLAAALDVSVAYLLGETDTKRTAPEQHQDSVMERMKALGAEVYPVRIIPLFSIEDFRGGWPSTEQCKDISYMVLDDSAGPLDEANPPFALEPARWNIADSTGITDQQELAINPAMPFENGKLCFIRYNGVPMVRLVYQSSDGTFSLQSDLPPVTVAPENIEFLGRVRATMRRIS